MKRKYEEPVALKIEFDYAETVVASGGKNPAQCTGHNPGHGCGYPYDPDVEGDDAPGNCSQDQDRKNAKFGCF